MESHQSAGWLSVWFKQGEQAVARREMLVEALSMLLQREFPGCGIVTCGIGGLIPAVQVAAKLRVPLAVVRKSDDACHSALQYEGPLDCPVVMLDDCIDRGGTFRHVRSSLPESVSLRGLVTYSQGLNDRARDSMAMTGLPCWHSAPATWPAFERCVQG